MQTLGSSRCFATVHAYTSWLLWPRITKHPAPRSHSWPRSLQCLPNAQHLKPLPLGPLSSPTSSLFLKRTVSAKWISYFVQNIFVNSNPPALLPPISSYTSFRLSPPCTHGTLTLSLTNICSATPCSSRGWSFLGLFLCSWQVQFFSFWYSDYSSSPFLGWELNGSHGLSPLQRFEHLQTWNSISGHP